MWGIDHSACLTVNPGLLGESVPAWSYSSWLYSWDSIIPVYNWTGLLAIFGDWVHYEFTQQHLCLQLLFFVVFNYHFFFKSPKYKQIYFKNNFKWTQTRWKQSTTCSNACTRGLTKVSCLPNEAARNSEFRGNNYKEQSFKNKVLVIN